MAAARQRGVDRLLHNPQNLELLAKSVAGGEWPNTRQETFEQACRILVRSSGPPHDPLKGEVAVLLPHRSAVDPPGQQLARQAERFSSIGIDIADVADVAIMDLGAVIISIVCCL